MSDAVSYSDRSVSVQYPYSDIMFIANDIFAFSRIYYDGQQIYL